MSSAIETRDVDPYLPNAYSSSRVKFDMAPPPKYTGDGPTKPSTPSNILGNTSDSVQMKKTAKKGWELDVRGLTSTKKWLNNYGLKKNKLDINSLMLQIGFKRRNDFDYSMKKPIPSKYAVTQFLDKWTSINGKTTNIAVSKGKMEQLISQLKQAIHLFERRMEWLTSESRRVFGVIQETCVNIVLDIKTMSPQQFDQYRCAVEKVLKEQVAQLAKFNLIRATEEPLSFKSESVPVTQKSIDEAVDWLWTLDRTTPYGTTSTCEAVMKAMEDKQANGIYLFTYGSSAEPSVELLTTNCRAASRSLHVIAYNCTDSDVMKSLKCLCDTTHGRFHAYGVIMEMQSFDPLPLEEGSSKANVMVRKKTIGGVPPGAGIRQDVIKLFEELEESRSNLAQMESLTASMPDAKQSPYKRAALTGKSLNAHSSNAEEYMGSADWVNTNGLKVKKLGFYDLLGKVAFRHCDGVVNVKQAPPPDAFITDAVSTNKLVNARYCDQFAHVKYKDGTIVHVQITPEVHRVYADKVASILDKIDHRVTWLQQGSRELFGTIIERKLYLIIDTSASMAPSLQFVKDKLYLLLQEQIRHKDAFNIISFGSKISPWRDRLVDVNEDNLKAAWSWIKALETDGSTNTLGALKYAMADPLTEGIYLLSDGRPDHPPKSVLAQVTLQKSIPIHAISFNCADAEANRFLCQLAKDTQGRYHYFSEHGEDVEGPEPYQSEDIRLLREEYELGEAFLAKVESLRDECQELQWKRSANAKFSRMIPAPRLNRPKSATVSLRVNKSPRERPTSARPLLPTSQSAPTLHTSHHRPSKYARVTSSYQKEKKPSVAAHTRTSLLRTLSASGAQDWALPETKAMLRGQFKPVKPMSVKPAEKQEKTAESPPNKKLSEPKKRKLMASKNWLLKHGLRAKKLLLLDALTDAISKDTEKSVQLDMHIISRLVDEELSPRNSTRRDDFMTNPYLEECLLGYETKLESASESYTERLDKIVWESLSDTEKRKYKHEYDDDEIIAEAISFSENRTDLMESLDASGWLISQNDIVLLEQEIQKAEKFLVESQNIREASQRYESRQPGYKPMPVTDDTTVRTAQKIRAPDALKGQRVAARKSSDGFYYTGLVLKSKGAHHAVVQFDDEEDQIVPKQFVIPIKGAIAVPSLYMGDYVLTLVKGPKDTPFYAPGQVELTPKQALKDNGRFFEVSLYNGNKVSALRSSLVKIGKARYNLSVAYIEEHKSGETQRDDSADERSDDENEEDIDSKTITREVVLDALDKYHGRLEDLCLTLIKKQKDYKSRQKRLHRQMKKVHKEYKIIRNSKGEDVDNTKQVTFTSLEGIEPGEEVLARWLDEGWYYRCQVFKRVSERTYMLQDSCGDLQQTSREDIIADNDDLASRIDEGAHIIALHPNYYCSYAPGIVEEVFDDYSCSVTFYDDTRSIVERDEIFITDQEKYEQDVEHILKCEDELIGQAAVARDNGTGEFKLGSIKSKTGCRQYLVEWSDGNQCKQSCIHIFGVFSRNYNFNVGDHCISVCDEKTLNYLPGVVTGRTKTGIHIKFINGARQQNVNPLKSFWISHIYYEAATAYYNNRNNKLTEE